MLAENRHRYVRTTLERIGFGKHIITFFLFKREFLGVESGHWYTLGKVEPQKAKSERKQEHISKQI